MHFLWSCCHALIFLAFLFAILSDLGLLISCFLFSVFSPGFCRFDAAFALYED